MCFAWATAFGVVAALATIIRLITTPQAGAAPPGAHAAGPVLASATNRLRLRSDDDYGDYGLLRAVATADTPARAAEVRRRLARAGVRTTTATGADGRIMVL